MFVFPAFNDSYKTRKRTFRCCKICRSKRIRCRLSDPNYEKAGCDNCKALGIICDLIAKKTSSARYGTVEGNGKSEPAPKEEDAAKTEPAPVVNDSKIYANDVQLKSEERSSPRREPPSSQEPFDGKNGPANVPGAVFPESRSSSCPSILSNPTTSVDSFPSRVPSNTNIEASQIADPLQKASKEPPKKRQRRSRSMETVYGPASPNTYHTRDHQHREPAMNPPNGTSPLTSQWANKTFHTEIPENDKAHLDLIPQSSLFRLQERAEYLSKSGVNSYETFSSPGQDSHEILAMDSLESNIHMIDLKFLKNHFGFNTTFRQSQYYFTKLVSRKHIKAGATEALPEDISRIHRKATKHLDKSHLLQFKFLLTLHAFTLDTPGFYHITDKDLLLLYDIYFYKVNSIFPIVFEEEFWELYKRNKIPSIIMYGVVLTAARDELAEPILARSFLNNGVSYEENKARFIRELEMKIRQIMDFLPELGDTEKLARLISSLLLCLNYRFNKFGNEQSSQDVAEAVSYAYSLLIHHKFFHDRIVKEGAIRKSLYLQRLWWVIVVFDRFNGLLNGKAMYVNKLDFNLDRPRDLPHLDRLVLMSYALHDTLMAIFRPQKRIGRKGPFVYNDHIQGDPVLKPGEFIEKEVKVLEDLDALKSFLHEDEETLISPTNHLPNIPVERYRDRMVFFIERIVHFQMTILLRTGQIKFSFESSGLDNMSFKIGLRMLDILNLMKCGKNHKMLMETPMVPSFLSVALSLPISARAKIMHANNSASVASEKIIQIDKLANDYLKELKLFSGKWWFVHEFLNSLGKFNMSDIGDNKRRSSEKPAQQSSKSKLSIHSLVSDMNDPESVLPASLSITSPGCYDNIIIKEESDGEEQEQGENGSAEEPIDFSKVAAFDFPSQSLDTPLLTSEALAAKAMDRDFGNDDLHPTHIGSLAGSDTSVTSTDPFNFDVAQLAEVVNSETSIISNVMDFFLDPQFGYYK